MSTSSGCIHPYPAVRLRGLPFASSREEIADFLEVRPIDIVFQERGGRPNGVAFVLLSSTEDYQQCLDKDKQNLGSRYIEVFPCARSEFHHAVAEEVRGPFSRGAPPFHESPGAGRGRGGSRDREFPRGGVVGGQGGDGRRAPPPIPHDPAINPRGIEAVVKLRGLPFEATPADVTRWINDKVRSREAFLSVPVVAEDVVVATKNGSSIGIAFVEFKNYQDAERMLVLDRKYFGQRYVEVSMTTLEDQQRLTGAV